MPPYSALTAEQVRAGFAEQLKMVAGPPVALESVEDINLPGPAGPIRVRKYAPSLGRPLPGILYFHGGGWVIGDLDTHDNWCRELAKTVDCVVISVDYRLAPEHPFPAAVDDAVAATRWVVKNGHQLGVDVGRVAVAGDSAGANLATVTALVLRDDPGPKLAFQSLIYPVCDLLSMATESCRAFAEGYGLTLEAMHWFRGQYLTDAALAEDFRVSPLRHDNLANLPPALVVTAEFDVLRDEGEAYARKLQAAGVQVQTRRYDGMVHGFVSMAGILDVGKQARVDIAGVLSRALHSTP